MEMEAKRAYFIDDAEKPAAIISTSIFVAPDAKKGEWCSVYFGQGIQHWNTKTLKQAEAKVEEIFKTAKKPIRVKVVDQDNNPIKFLRFGAVVT